MNLKAQRNAELKAARDIAEVARKEARGLTDEERTKISGHLAEADRLKALIEAAEKDEELFAQLDSITPEAAKEAEDPKAAKTLGEHFKANVSLQDLRRVKSRSGATLDVPEFKASTDAHTVGEVWGPVLTQFDPNIVREYRRPTVADLFGSGSLSGNAVSYVVEGPVEGNFATVAEGAQKPQIHFGDPTARTDALKKIAAWWDVSDEMAEDLDFWVSEINNRGLHLLSIAEETQLLKGDGTGANIQGLLNREGIQTLNIGSDTAADALFKAQTRVQTATDFAADGVIINPLDYEKLRLAKDGNNQYYGGGFFTGQYGQGGVMEQPPIWGLRTVVSTAVDAGTAVVGAFKVATTVYRKGGVRVETTNSDQGKFTSNILTTRVEERVALAVRVPAAVVKVDLTATGG